MSLSPERRQARESAARPRTERRFPPCKPSIRARSPFVNMVFATQSPCSVSQAARRAYRPPRKKKRRALSAKAKRPPRRLRRRGGRKLCLPDISFICPLPPRRRARPAPRLPSPRTGTPCVIASSPQANAPYARVSLLPAGARFAAFSSTAGAPCASGKRMSTWKMPPSADTENSPAYRSTISRMLTIPKPW